MERRPIAAPDPHETQALAIAARELKALSPTTGNPEAVATAVISRWIIERVKLSTGNRLHEAIVFDLKNAKLRGFIETALSQIGGALSHLDATKPLFELSKDEVVDVFLAGIDGACAAAVAQGENSGFPFDDPIPWGD